MQSLLLTIQLWRNYYRLDMKIHHQLILQRNTSTQLKVGLEKSALQMQNRPY